MIVRPEWAAVNRARAWGGRARRLIHLFRPPLPLRRPNLDELAASEKTLPTLVRECPVALRYLRLLGELPWRALPGRRTDRAWPGPQPAPRAPYAAAFLVKIDRRLPYMSDLRRFLVEHPALVWVLGFPLVADRSSRWGFNVEASVPSRKQLGRVLRELPEASLRFLLDEAVSRLEAEVPESEFGGTIGLDTKHILAWVKQNNPKAYVSKRFDPEQQPAGDPDCRLGCKRRHNTPPHQAQPASSKSGGTFYWGYASGVVTTIVRGVDVVLAELTQTFDKGDVTYFQPLMAEVERRLGHRPRFGAFDAAFDAFYVYDYFNEAGGFAAVPLVAKGGVSERSFDPAGNPICDAAESMSLDRTFTNRTSLVEHQRGVWTCPLIGKADRCPVDHAKWPKGGCKTTMATAPGARLRYQIDRADSDYKAVYKQRTATERINSQALDLGIERPKLRNRAAIANHNSLLYVLIDLRALGRVRAAAVELTAAA